MREQQGVYPLNFEVVAGFGNGVLAPKANACCSHSHMCCVRGQLCLEIGNAVPAAQQVAWFGVPGTTSVT